MGNELIFDKEGITVTGEFVTETRPSNVQVDYTCNEEQHMKICAELSDTYMRKNRDYGDSFTKSFKEFGPMMCAIRLDDKINRYKTLIKKQGVSYVNESLEDTLLDLANYAIMSVMCLRNMGEE